MTVRRTQAVETIVAATSNTAMEAVHFRPRFCVGQNSSSAPGFQTRLRGTWTSRAGLEACPTNTLGIVPFKVQLVADLRSGRRQYTRR